MLARKNKASIGLVIAAASLTGCAAVDGIARPVIDTGTMRASVARYPVGQAVQSFYGTVAERQGLSRRDYRDMVVAIYLSAVDAEFYEFRQQLSTSSKGSSLGLDLVVLALTGVAAVAKQSAVNELATAATVAGGARASIDKNLFFDKTLPALVAAMDAERARVRLAIAGKLELDEARYPMSAAFNDIYEYQLAGSIDRALSRVTSVATSDAADAQARLDRAILACEVVTDVAEDNDRLADVLEAGDSARQTSRVKIAASALDVPEGASPGATKLAILGVLDKDYCSKGDRKAVVDRVIAAIAASEATPAGAQDNDGGDDGG